MKKDITKDAQFLEKCKWNIKKYATTEGGRLCDPGQWQ